MNPSLIFWTAALVDLLAVTILAAIGIRAIRRNQLARHRRCMKTAAALVACFLGAYPLKLLGLGREPLSEWSGDAVLVLRVHEICVFAMTAAGLTALLLSRAMHRNRHRLTQLPDAPLAPQRALRRHRIAGWTAAVAAGLALLTAAKVLLGMYERAAGS